MEVPIVGLRREHVIDDNLGVQSLPIGGVSDRLDPPAIRVAGMLANPVGYMTRWLRRHVTAQIERHDEGAAPDRPVRLHEGHVLDKEMTPSDVEVVPFVLKAGEIRTTSDWFA
jgi:hypothetical protein